MSGFLIYDNELFKNYDNELDNEIIKISKETLHFSSNIITLINTALHFHIMKLKELAIEPDYDTQLKIIYHEISILEHITDNLFEYDIIDINGLKKCYSYLRCCQMQKIFIENTINIHTIITNKKDLFLQFLLCSYIIYFEHLCVSEIRLLSTIINIANNYIFDSCLLELRFLLQCLSYCSFLFNCNIVECVQEDIISEINFNHTEYIVDMFTKLNNTYNEYKQSNHLKTKSNLFMGYMNRILSKNVYNKLLTNFFDTKKLLMFDIYNNEPIKWFKIDITNFYL
jgi:hypothetical protein